MDSVVAADTIAVSTCIVVIAAIFVCRKFHGRHNQPSALSMDGEGRK